MRTESNNDTSQDKKSFFSSLKGSFKKSVHEGYAQFIAMVTAPFITLSVAALAGVPLNWVVIGGGLVAASTFLAIASGAIRGRDSIAENLAIGSISTGVATVITAVGAMTAHAFDSGVSGAIYGAVILGLCAGVNHVFSGVVNTIVDRNPDINLELLSKGVFCSYVLGAVLTFGSGFIASSEGIYDKKIQAIYNNGIQKIDAQIRDKIQSAPILTVK